MNASDRNRNKNIEILIQVIRLKDIIVVRTLNFHSWERRKNGNQIFITDDAEKFWLAHHARFFFIEMDALVIW